MLAPRASAENEEDDLLGTLRDNFNAVVFSKPRVEYTMTAKIERLKQETVQQVVSVAQLGDLDELPMTSSNDQPRFAWILSLRVLGSGSTVQIGPARVSSCGESRCGVSGSEVAVFGKRGRCGDYPVPAIINN